MKEKIQENTRNKKHIAFMSFFWNAFYAGFNALQSAIILLAISRVMELGMAGIITIGFTVATLVMIIARYGIRNYQVTDVDEEYSFAEYFYARVVTVFFSLIGTFFYLAYLVNDGTYSYSKAAVVFEIVLLKLVDAFEGVYVGRLQQKGRLDIGARISTIRIVLSTTCVFLCIWVFKDVFWALLTGIIVSIVLDVFLISSSQKYSTYMFTGLRRENIKKLLLVALPLCIGTALHNYVGNAPKYLVDIYMTDEIQAVSGYIMMPMFVITLLNTFLMQPTVKDLGEAWSRHEFDRLKKKVLRHISVISCASGGVLVLGIFVGLPFLSWLYRLDLTVYHKEFCFLMIGGTLYTLSAYGIVLLTTMRKQKWILNGCLITMISYLGLGRFFVEKNGLVGATEIYIIANVLLLIIFLVGIVRTIIIVRSREKNVNNGYDSVLSLGKKS